MAFRCSLVVQSHLALHRVASLSIVKPSVHACVDGSVAEAVRRGSASVDWLLLVNPSFFSSFSTAPKRAALRTCSRADAAGAAVASPRSRRASFGPLRLALCQNHTLSNENRSSGGKSL